MVALKTVVYLCQTQDFIVTDDNIYVLLCYCQIWQRDKANKAKANGKQRRKLNFRFQPSHFLVRMVAGSRRLQDALQFHRYRQYY